jgi:hypothetical protein
MTEKLAFGTDSSSKNLNLTIEYYGDGDDDDVLLFFEKVISHSRGE